MSIAPEDLSRVVGRESLFAFLKNKLNWPLDPEDPYTYSEQEVAGRASARAQVSRLLPFTGSDPFAIFLVEFDTDFRRTDLREILRGIRDRIKRFADYQGASLESLVFVCATEGYKGLRFCHFEEQAKRQAILRLFGFDRENVAETRTLCEYNLSRLSLPPGFDIEPNWDVPRKTWLEAWDVEQVTEAFFTAFEQRFQLIESIYLEKTKDVRWSHDAALQFLSRLLFLYFLQRKKSEDQYYWLGNDRHFISNYFRIYQEQNRIKETFHSDWLNVLFFEAFNSQFQAGRADYSTRFPKHILEALAIAPYLNGGLFRRNELDAKYSHTLPDSVVENLLTFFDRYNFTVLETTPFDVEVAVDPEMIGKVYESLVNVEHEAADQRSTAGCIYTPY